MTTPASPASVEHIVVLMLEDRSFDAMLGYLYADAGNSSPLGQRFEGLSGSESNADAAGAQVNVFKLDAATEGAYFAPGADPGEGYIATNEQLFRTTSPPVPPVASNSGFVCNFGATLAWAGRQGRSILPGTVASDIMGSFTPEMLPVLSGLARGYAVCDQWFASAPTETLPNRAFAHSATSQGHMDDDTKSYTCPTIFGSLSAHGVSWTIYGYDAEPLTRFSFADTTTAPDANFGRFADFTTAAMNGSLAAYSFLEPSWGSTGNSQHPNYDVSLGEQLIFDVYQALHSGPAWAQTLLIITYDEHGGCYDHVAPPGGAVPPDASIGEFGFDFRRFGVRVPTVLVSPLIEAGTVFRVPPGAMPLDHTSILRTVEERFGIPALTARDAAATGVIGALNLPSPRTDDPLAGVVVPTSTGANPAAEEPSHLQQVYAQLVSRLPVPDPSGAVLHSLPALRTTEDYTAYINERTTAWRASRRREPGPAAPG